MRAHHYSLQVPLTVLHTRRCSVFPKLYPIPKLFSFFLSLSFCLSALPCYPQFETLPLKTLSGLAFLVCLVEFSPPGRTTTFFTLSLDTDTNLSRNRPHRRSIPLRALLIKTKWKRKQNKREFTSIAASDQTKKSICICTISTYHTIHLYNYPFRCCLLFSQQQQQQQQPKPAPPLPCHKSKEKQSKAKKEGSTQFHLVTAPGLPLYLFRSHSLPFWEVAQVQYIYTYYDPRKNLHVDSLLPR